MNMKTVIKRPLGKRYGYHLTCRGCKQRFFSGGIIWHKELQTRIAGTKKQHSETCLKTRWLLSISHHAAEIEHTSTEKTAISSTASNSYIDVSAAEIADTEFTAGEQYLIVVVAQVRSDNANADTFTRLVHGSTEFAGSEYGLEVAAASVMYSYMYAAVWTAVASEEVKMQFKTAANTVGVDNVTLFAMNLDNDLTPNTDWFWDEDESDTGLSTTWSATNNASVSFTPLAGNDWLVFACSRVAGDSTSVQMESRINASGTITDTEPKWTQEGEDTTNGFQLHGLARVYKALGAVAQTFTQQSRSDNNAATGPRTYSNVFALNLNKFDAHDSAYTAAEIALADADYGTEVQTITIVPSTSTDVWSMAHGILDGDASAYCRFRLQVDNNDEPATQTADAYNQNRFWDVTDELGCIMMGVTSLSGSTPVDFDADDQATGAVMEDRTLFAVTMELAAGDNVSWGLPPAVARVGMGL